MEKLYIKFNIGNEESFRIACENAEELGYQKWGTPICDGIGGTGLLQCDGEYYNTTSYGEYDLIGRGYKEHFINNTMKYKEGDILVNTSGDARKILGICGEIYFLSRANELDMTSMRYNTIQELDSYGLKLKTEPKTGIREVTMHEIEEAFGEPVIIRE